MNYVNREMRIDQLVGYFNAGKINLIPAFQRASVWTPTLRKRLIANILRGRPIPAIFLYKEESGSMFAYSILDGKQRLESLMLFVGNKNKELRIANLNDYFFDKEIRKLRNFGVELDGKNTVFADLDDKTLREFREYAIPTIEISLEESSIAEIVELFVDINTYGIKVSRFDVVKAMVRDPFLGSVLSLIADKQKREKVYHYKAKSSPISAVLRHVNVIARIQPGNTRVDRMWERLAEIALFARTGRHRKPIDILSTFIKGGDVSLHKIDKGESVRIRNVFKFLAKAYKTTGLGKSKLATDQPQFYTMVTSLLGESLLTKYSEPDLTRRLAVFANIVDGRRHAPAELADDITRYNELVSTRTTDVGRRGDRQKIFISAVNQL